MRGKNRLAFSLAQNIYKSLTERLQAVSFKAAAWAIEQSVTKSAAQKLVLIALADAHNGQTGRCDPSIQRVADICHMSYRTVTRTLIDLESLGLISRKNRTDKQQMKTSNSYVLRMGQIDLTIGQDDPSMGHGDLMDRSSTTPHDRSLCPINQEVINQEVNQEYPPTPQGGFDEFWQAYPKRVGKGAAEKSWQKLAEPDRAAVMQDLRQRPFSDPQWLKDGGQFIPNPATYLNQKRFDDHWEPAGQALFSDTTRQNIENLREWANGN